MFLSDQAHKSAHLDEQLPALLDDLLNGIETPLWLLTLEGRIQAANLAALDLLGYEPDEMRIQTLEALLADRALALLISQGLLRDGVLVNFHLPLRTKDGQKVPVALDSRLLYGKYEQPVGVLMVANDLRKGDRLHQKLVQSAKMAAMGHMAAGIAHEINNPLTGVLGLVELLLEDERLTRDIRDDLETLQAHAQRCKVVVERLLGLARAQEDLRWEPVDLNGVVEEALRLAANELKVHRVAVTRELDPALPECWTDRHHVLQVFLNLIVNASKAMPGGGSLTVRSRVYGDRVAIEFQDAGVGIPEADLEKIFEPFYTTSSGLGLGLSLSQTIIRALGGEVRASSRVGDGSCFAVEMQLLVPELEGVAWQCLRSLRDRRRTPRLEERYQVESPALEATLFTCDIASGGIRVEIPQPLPLHGDHALTLDLDGTDVAVKGRVMWQEPADGGYEAGLMFTEVSPQAEGQLKSFLDRKLQAGGEGRRRRLRLPRLRYVRFEHPSRARTGIGSGVLLDLSSRGAKMMSGLRLDPDARITLCIEFDLDRTVSVPALVRWHSSLERMPHPISERYLHGLEFLEETTELDQMWDDFLSRRTRIRLTDISGGLRTLLGKEPGLA